MFVFTLGYYSTQAVENTESVCSVFKSKTFKSLMKCLRKNHLKNYPD